MTGAHAGGPTGRRSGRSGRSGRSLAWRIGTPAVALLSGTLFVVSGTNSDGTDLRPGRYTDLAGLVAGEASDYQRIEDRFNELSDEVDRLGAGVSDERVTKLRRQQRELRDPAGTTARRGPGIRITLSDAPEELLDAAVAAGVVKLNRFVVHQQDIQAVVNALWAGGASAVTIAGQRVVSTTGIRCQGPVVQLQGVPYPQPYVIEAVGDQGELLTAVAADELVSLYRADSEDPKIGIGWDLETAADVRAPAYDAVLDLQYAKPLR